MSSKGPLAWGNKLAGAKYAAQRLLLSALPRGRGRSSALPICEVQVHGPGPHLEAEDTGTTKLSPCSVWQEGQTYKQQLWPQQFMIPFALILTAILRGRGHHFHGIEATCPKSHNRTWLLILAPFLTSFGQETSLPPCAPLSDGNNSVMVRAQ